MSVKKINPKDVKITLLTKKQAEKLPVEILNKGSRWWLRSPYNSNLASVVDSDGWEWLVIADFVNQLVKEMTED